MEVVDLHPTITLIVEVEMPLGMTHGDFVDVLKKVESVFKESNCQSRLHSVKFPLKENL